MTSYGCVLPSSPSSLPLPPSSLPLFLPLLPLFPPPPTTRCRLALAVWEMHFGHFRHTMLCLTLVRVCTCVHGCVGELLSSVHLCVEDIWMLPSSLVVQTVILCITVCCVFLPSSNHGERDCKWLPDGGCCHHTRYIAPRCVCVRVCVSHLSLPFGSLLQRLLKQ